MPDVTSPSDKHPDNRTNLDCILKALATSGRLPCERPETAGRSLRGAGCRKSSGSFETHFS
ncbi:hypothetical protein AB9K41_25985 [Cribrihabitans sp. XS_ASV171]